MIKTDSDKHLLFYWICWFQKTPIFFFEFHHLSSHGTLGKTFFWRSNKYLMPLKKNWDLNMAILDKKLAIWNFQLGHFGPQHGHFGPKLGNFGP